MKPVALFAGLTLAVIALTGFAIAAAYGSPDASRAIWTSAAVAFAVQVMSFAIVKLSAKTNVMAGWASAPFFVSSCSVSMPWSS